MQQVSLFGRGLRAGVAGACVAVLSMGCGLEGGWLRLQGQGRLVFGCALMRARAGKADLPYFMHLLEVTFRAWRPSSVRKLTCCNAASELFACELNAGVAGACDAVLSVGCGLEGEGGDVIAGAGQGCVWVCTDARACRNGESLVYAASLRGHVSCVEALILAKADVLQCNK